jgi:hypothetical protein
MGKKTKQQKSQDKSASLTPAQKPEDTTELNDKALEEVSGGKRPPRDASTGLATGKRIFKPF